MSLLKFIGTLAYEIVDEAWRERKRRKAAEKAWAERQARIRACPQCNEIAYTPGQMACNRCSAVL